MMKQIEYKDKLYYLGFTLDIIMSKVNHLFHVGTNTIDDNVYKITFMTIEKESTSSKYALDIYINEENKNQLFDTIEYILSDENNIDETEVVFSNRIDCHNRVYYKLSQFIDTDCGDLGSMFINMILKIYRDKNFVVIEPKVSYSYLLATKDLDVKFYPVLLSDNIINEIKSNCEKQYK